MAFEILNEDDSFNARQSGVDAGDIEILVAAYNGTGVISGCAVTAQGSPDMTLAVAVGVIVVNDGTPARATVSSGNVTITAADGTNPRFDLVIADASGTKSVAAGTAAAVPVYPAYNGTTHVCLAAVYVPANDTTIENNQITDKRVITSIPVVALADGTARQIITWDSSGVPEAVNAGAVLDYGLSFQAIVTTFTDTTHFEASGLTGLGDDYFNGYFAFVAWDAGGAGAAPQGEIRAISAYTSSSGAFTHIAFSGALTTTDEVLIIHPAIAYAAGAAGPQPPTGSSIYDVLHKDGNFTFDNTTDSLEALRDLLATIPTTAMRGTDSAALASVLGALDSAAAAGAVTNSDLAMAYLKQVVTNQLATTHEMTFFSEVDDLITVNAAAADETFPPVTVADVPAGATVVRAILGVIVGEFEDTSTAENSVVLAGTEHFQIDKTGGTYIDAIKLLAGQWLTPASGRRGGTVLIGDIDISSEVDDNDTYEIKWEGADVTGASLLLRDVQTFIKLWYTIE